MDHTWMSLHRASDEFKCALSLFLDDYFYKNAIGEQIFYPCKECQMRYCHRRDKVYDHLVVDGFSNDFKQWVHRREHTSKIGNFRDGERDGERGGERNNRDDIDGLLHDTFTDVTERLDTYQGQGVRDGPNEEAMKFYKLVEDGKQDLYPGCKSFSKLSFLIRLYLYKCLNSLSNVEFNDLLELLREAFPEAKLPQSFNEAKSTVRDLGLDYKKIHACPNDCMLFWKEHEKADFCTKCTTSRWKSENVPAKVLRHFPLKPRLQRLYMCSQTAKEMLWHDKERPKDGNLRHPADGQAWKEFDSMYPFFSQDPRNVRLGLGSDGFNPFRTMSVAHSTWPVVLINYNLPPWLSMKPEYLMLSLLIPGPRSPGNDIDIYLQPLIDELKDLWEVGVETYDAFSQQLFRMHAALLCTVSDFPAYSMFSGWSTKGRWACPYCNFDTCSQYLKHSRKTCYMGHRRFLDMSHLWRLDERSFNDKRKEERLAPRSLSGSETLCQLKDFKDDYGKKKEKK